MKNLVEKYTNNNRIILKVSKKKKNPQNHKNTSINFTKMRFSIIITVILAIILLFKPTWSTLVFRVTISAFDVELWQGLRAEVSSNPNSLNNNNNKHDTKLFSFKPMPQREIRRRRFLFFEQTGVPSLQSWILSLYHKLFPRQIMLHTTDNYNVETEMKILSRSELDEKEKEQFASKSFVTFQYKIYDSSFSYQFAPPTDLRDELQIEKYVTNKNNEEGQTENDEEGGEEEEERKTSQNERKSSTSQLLSAKLERHQWKQVQVFAKQDEQNIPKTTLPITNDISRSSSSSIDESASKDILPGFKQIFNLLLSQKLKSIRVEFPSSIIIADALLFAKRGFPAWNILPSEGCVVEVKLVF